MLFTAPAFAFVFLPLSILFLVMFGKKQKKLCLLTVCIVYHVFLHVSSPLELLWLPLLVLYTYTAERTARVMGKRWLTFSLCAFPVALTVVVRSMLYLGAMEGNYPLGITVPVLCAVSYICDGTERKKGLSELVELALYLFFFHVGK